MWSGAHVAVSIRGSIMQPHIVRHESLLLIIFMGNVHGIRRKTPTLIHEHAYKPFSPSLPHRSSGARARHDLTGDVPKFF